MKICLTCDTIFQREPYYLNTVNYDGITPCPIHNCYGEVVDIDDNFFEAIRTLNRLDYRTKFCCSGHTWSNSAYICFEEGIVEQSFPNLPHGFTPDKDQSHGLLIRSSSKGTTTSEQLISLAEIASELTNWTESLGQSKIIRGSFKLKKKTDAKEFAEKMFSTLNLLLYEYKMIDSVSFIEFDLTIAPLRLKSYTKELRKFASENGETLRIETF